MNKIIYNLNTYQLIEIDFSQILVVGQENAINIDLYFKNGDVFKVDTDWQVWLTFERPDGESTNITLATLNNDHYSKKIGSWFTAVAGIGKIFTIIKVNGETIAPFAVAKVQIFEGGTPSDDTISQEQYNELLSNINDVNNKLENHINDKNNPHEVTPEQLNVYEKEHVDFIDGRLVVVEEELPLIKTDIADIKNKDTEQDLRLDNVETKANKNENNKLDKKPYNNVDLINALGKIDTRYLDIGEDFELFTIVMTLPPISEAILNKIYLVPTQTREEETFNDFTEYFVWEGKWETLGSVGINLNDFYTKNEIGVILGDYALKSDLNNINIDGGFL